MKGFKSIAEQAARSLGGASVLRAIRAGRPRILMYHRFPGSGPEIRARLTAQCEHLRRYYHPISIAELEASLRENRAIPPRSVAITVDDGYSDFAHAFPVFKSFGWPVTLYVVSEFASGEIWLWPDRLRYLIEHSKHQTLSVPLPTSAQVTVDTRTPESRSRAFQGICEPLICAENSDRLRALQSLAAIFDVEIPKEIPLEFAPLSWDLLRELAANGLDVGCHTRTHPILSRLTDELSLVDEVAGAKNRLEAMLERTVGNFCYPNGRSIDFNEASVSAVKKAGFETAVTTESGLIGPQADPFRLPRLGVEPHFTALYFERLVAGYRAMDDKV